MPKENITDLASIIKSKLDIENLRSQFKIPNDQVAQNLITMDAFDAQMRPERKRIIAKNIIQHLLAVFLIYLMYQSLANRKSWEETLTDYMYMLITAGLAYGTNKATERYLGWSPLFLTNLQSNIQKRNIMRSALITPTPSINALKEKVEVITKAGVAQCYELGFVLCNKLHEFEELSGKWITQLALICVTNPQQNHTVDLISDFKLDNVKNLTLVQLAKNHRKNPILLVDLWYKLVLPLNQLNATEHKDCYPLLFYQLTGEKDYEAKIEPYLQLSPSLKK